MAQCMVHFGLQYLSMYVCNDEWTRDFFWMKNQRTSRKEKLGKLQTCQDGAASASSHEATTAQRGTGLQHDARCASCGLALRRARPPLQPDPHTGRAHFRRGAHARFRRAARPPARPPTARRRRVRGEASLASPVGCRAVALAACAHAGAHAGAQPGVHAYTCAHACRRPSAGPRDVPAAAQLAHAGLRQLRDGGLRVQLARARAARARPRALLGRRAGRWARRKVRRLVQSSRPPRGFTAARPEAPRPFAQRRHGRPESSASSASSWFCSTPRQRQLVLQRPSKLRLTPSLGTFSLSVTVPLASTGPACQYRPLLATQVHRVGRAGRPGGFPAQRPACRRRAALTLTSNPNPNPNTQP